MKVIFGSVLLFCVFFISASSGHSQESQAPVRGKFVPPDGKVLFITGQGQGTNDALDYIRVTGRIPSGFMFYTSVQDIDGMDKPSIPYYGAEYGRFFVDNYSNTVLQIGLAMSPPILDIVEGNYDDNLKKIAEWIKRSKRPVYLRIGYEFDFPENNYDPDDYVKVYRYIVDKFRAWKAENIAYVWHSYGKVREIPISRWYPGDEYVDWCGISYFAQGSVEMKKMTYFAKMKNKPLMLAETTPYGIGVLDGEKSWNSWFAPLFKFIRVNNVKALCYINNDWETVLQFKGKGWGNSRVQDNPYVFGEWMKEITNGTYLDSSQELFAELGYTNRE